MNSMRNSRSLFRRLLFVLILIHLEIPSTFPQSTGMGPYQGARLKPWRGDPRCRRASELNLSQEQLKGYEAIQQAFFRDAQLLRVQLFSKRLELKEYLTNPGIKLEVLRNKTSEILEHQNKLEEKSLDYLIKVRALLNPDQLKIWCPDHEFPNFRRMMQGPDMGPLPIQRPSLPEGVKPE